MKSFLYACSLAFAALALAAGCASMPIALQASDSDAVYTMPADVQTRWASFENPTAAKGAGGTANKGAKGSAYKTVSAGAEAVLLDVQGSGIVHRIWLTLRERDPQMLRSLRLEMYWDGATTPAVSVPLGDFFGAINGQMVPLENALLSNPEGRSFNAYFTMPFRTGARIVLTNDSDRPVGMLFYDVNFTLQPVPADALYFHAAWRRERFTTLGKDFAILPQVQGKGRFLGAHVGILINPANVGWWGEGEVKMYLDGDTDLPTLVGTGTEDYVGTGWGQDVFQSDFHGCTANSEKAVGFYRYHLPDPVYFHESCRVTLQQMGGAAKEQVLGMLDAGVPIQPVAILQGPTHEQVVQLMELPPDTDFKALPDDWTNFYREDDVSAVAFFYLNRPENNLPGMPAVEARIEGLE
jgi:hypothetical protein